MRKGGKVERAGRSARMGNCCWDVSYGGRIYFQKMKGRNKEKEREEGREGGKKKGRNQISNPIKMRSRSKQKTISLVCLERV